MKIAIITETFAPQINGVSRTLGRLVQHLLERGHEVLVVHPSYENSGNSAEKSGRPHNLKILELKAWPLPFYKEVRLPRPPFGAYKKALDEFQPDLVHIATEAALGLSALRFCRKRGWRVVSSFHTNFESYASHYRLRWAVPLVARYLRWFHNRTLATFVPSMTIIRQLEASGFERLRLWPRGVDTALFWPARPGAAGVRQRLGIPLEATVVGHCGRLAPEKNTSYLVEAFGEVLGRNQEAHVLIVGDGPTRAHFEEQLQALPGAAGRVHFTGYLTGEPLADAYSAMNMFAFASRTETFGNVLLEAMASGAPVVALAEGGPADVVQDGQTGRLLPPDAAPGEMAKVLLEWIADEPLRRSLGAEARRYAESQTWAMIMDRLVDDYLEVTGK